MTEIVDAVIVGGGVVGLAIGKALAQNGLIPFVLEAEGHWGSHTSSRNSEVIHAGIYYPPDSKKAKLCISGKEKLYRFCEEHNIPFQKTGKLIVATEEAQVARLEHIKTCADLSGVKDLVWLDTSAVKEKEPLIKGVRGLFSPSTGIVDSHALMLALTGAIENAGGVISCQTKVLSIFPEKEGFRVQTLCQGDEFEIVCRKLVNAAGLQAWDVAKSINGLSRKHIPEHFYARGDYYRLEGRPGIQRLVYPVPVDGGLGVHITLDLGGQIKLGPDVTWIDKLDYQSAFDRQEIFYRSVEQYFPSIRSYPIHGDYSGIRPKLVGPNGGFADFMIQGSGDHGMKGLVNLFGIESPGLTASLALAEDVVKRL